MSGETSYPAPGWNTRPSKLTARLARINSISNGLNFFARYTHQSLKNSDAKGGSMHQAWPDHFPDDCPPKTSDSANGRVYRLVGASPPNENDFLSWKQRSPNKDYGVKACQSCGLSVFVDLDHCRRLRRLVPALRKKHIATGELESQHGRIQNTPSNKMKEHYTWWVPEAVEEPWQLFQVVEATQ